MKRAIFYSLLGSLLLAATAQAETPAPGLNLSLPREAFNEDLSPSPAPQSGHANLGGVEGLGRPLDERAASEPRQRIDLPYGSGYEARRAQSTRSMSTRGMGRGRGR
jgi:hypothetical protein